MTEQQNQHPDPIGIDTETVTSGTMPNTSAEQQATPEHNGDGADGQAADGELPGYPGAGRP